jgi:uncharacterized membrane protein
MLKKILKYLLGIFFILVGIDHFRNEAFYLNIMPDYLPWHLELVYLSGVFEIVAGILLLIPRMSTYGAVLIIAILIGVYPANIHMFINSDRYPDIPKVVLFIRLLLQFVLVYWATIYIKKDK